jgi:hypothetical protein
MNGIDELKAARKRIREPEAAPADAHVDYCLGSAFLEMACGKLGTSAEELKKERRDACRKAKDGSAAGVKTGLRS